jgi:methylase of polypeptide subunit release factors
MGSGSGYFAFLLKKTGCKSVVALDFNLDAVNCGIENLLLNPELAPIDFIHSDLFKNAPAVKYDTIVFNFNYYPSNGVFGLNEDGGEIILKRFFSEVEVFINPDALIYIPYSRFVGKQHDPLHICTDFGFKAEVVASTMNNTGEHVIYRISLCHAEQGK